MKNLNIASPKSQMGELIDGVIAGGKVAITRQDKPGAELIAKLRALCR